MMPGPCMAETFHTLIQQACACSHTIGNELKRLLKMDQNAYYGFLGSIKTMTENHVSTEGFE